MVRRIAEEPSILKLSGEKREITALFTDIEGFTAMTHRAEPEQLVAVLDEYIEGVATIVMAHGGMVDKIVGELRSCVVQCTGRPRGSSSASRRLRHGNSYWVRTYQSRNEATKIGLGRTRIGVETGLAIVGDIGIRSKLDYTAHGDAVNSAARLEALNKEFGSTICVGPIATSRCEASLFRPLGVVVLRGLDAPVGSSNLGLRKLRSPGASVTWRLIGRWKTDRTRPPLYLSRSTRIALVIPWFESS